MVGVELCACVLRRFDALSVEGATRCTSCCSARRIAFMLGRPRIGLGAEDKGKLCHLGLRDRDGVGERERLLLALRERVAAGLLGAKL